MHKMHPRNGQWIKLASSVVVAFGLAASTQAQTTLIQDGFTGSYNGLGGTTPDTVDVPGTTWTTNHFNRGISAAYSSGNPVVADYSGNNTVAAGISFAGYGGTIDTLSVNTYKSAGNQSGNALVFGFSTVGTLTNSSVDAGSYQGYLLSSGGLAIVENHDGSGSLNLNGGGVASWSAPAGFVGSTGEGSTVGENPFTLSYNSLTNIATVTEDGNQVASVNVGALNLQSAGFGGFYLDGWNGHSSPDGFDNFTVTTGVPEPATCFAGFICLGLLLVKGKRVFSLRV